ncbi:MAG: hypothetical protein JKX82_02395 [Oleispira sp.]|nr:hypothetical protein [Oleispira sp.]
MNFYPIIKPCTWQGFQQTEQQFLQDLILDDPTVNPLQPLPKIVYAMDQDDQLAYIGEKFFQGKTDEEIKAKAYADLRRELAEENWQSLDLSDKCEGLRILVMQTLFYGSEVLLLEERMKEAGSLLNAERLLVCTPYRGLTFVLPFDDENKAALEVFLGVCYEHFNEPENDPISDVIWALQDGTVKGILDINQDFKEYHHSQTLKEATAPESVHAKDIKLFNSVQIGLGAFFGTPLAGLLLVSANLRNTGKQANRQTGKQATANIVAVVAVLIMPLIILLYANIP